MGILDKFILKRKKSGVLYKGRFSNIFNLTGEGEIIYREDCIYKGKFKFGEPEGNGVVYVGKDEFRGEVNSIIYRDQYIYERDDMEYSRNKIKITGEGKLICGNGSIYEGIFKYGRLVEGVCKIYFRDGQIYEGKCKNYEIHLYKDYIDKFEINGQGKLTNKKGDIYEGTFKSGNLIEGTCKVKLKDGRIYEGECKGKVPHGFGKLKYKNGTIEEGYFRNGKIIEESNKVDKLEAEKINNSVKKKIQTRTIHYRNGKVYEGEIKNGKPHGFGQMRYKNNRIYKGRFINGEREDIRKIYQDGSRYINKLGEQAKIIMSDGSIYEGECLFKNLYPNVIPVLDINGYEVSGQSCDYVPHGNGCLIDQDGKKYITGEFVDGKLNGTATIVHKNGDKHIGYFKNGKFEGNGKLIKFNKEVHKGEFKNGHLYGTDKMIFNGKVYKGEFVDGVVNGIGKLVKGGLYEYEGEFVDGVANGIGRLVKYGLYEYKGEFVDGIANGDCNMEFENIGIYIGKFVYNKITNEGKFIYKNGEEYEGQFLNGLPHGHGKLKYKKGGDYEGQFLNGMPHGYGKRNYIDESMYEGEFEKGKPVSGIKILPDKKKYIVKVNNGVFKKVRELGDREYREYINNIKNICANLNVEQKSIVEFNDVDIFCYDSSENFKNEIKQSLLDKNDVNKYLGLELKTSNEKEFREVVVQKVNKIFDNSCNIQDPEKFYAKKENLNPEYYNDIKWYNEVVNKTDAELAKNVIDIVGRIPTRPQKVDFWSATVFLSIIANFFRKNSNFTIYEQIKDVVIRWEYERELLGYNSYNNAYDGSLSSREYMDYLFKMTSDIGITDKFYNELMYHLDSRVEYIKQSFISFDEELNKEDNYDEFWSEVPDDYDENGKYIGDPTYDPSLYKPWK